MKVPGWSLLNTLGLTVVVGLATLSHLSHPGISAALQEPTPAPKSSVTSQTAWGVHTSTFGSPRGKIRASLPDDTAAGDTISGSVTAEPEGKTEEEKRRNLDELNGYVFDLGRAKVSVGEKVIKWAVPSALGGGLAYLILRDKDGNEVGRTVVPVQPTQPSAPHPETPSPADYHLPAIGQQGRPFQVTGPFDGDFANTGARIGGQEVKLLAESPRKLVGESPAGIVGPTEIEVKEGNMVAKGKYNNISLELSATTTTLRRNQRAGLDVKVAGLEGFDKNVRLRVQNNTPGVVRFGGTDRDLVRKVITLAEVRSSGTYQLPLTLIGVSPGHFNIVATATQDDPEHVEQLSDREDHPWEISSLPTHSVSDSDRRPHKEAYSGMQPHDPELSSVPPHGAAISNRAVSQNYDHNPRTSVSRHHGSDLSNRKVHDPGISARKMHSPSLSKSNQPPHDPRLSGRPRHEQSRSKSQP